MQPEDLVSVTILVPRQHVKSAYDWASSLLDKHTTSASDSTPVPPDGIEPEAWTGDGDEWTPELIRVQFMESEPFMQRLEKTLAAEPGRKFSTIELAERLDAKKGWKSIVGALGAYGRRTSNRYKMKTWPFKAVKDHVDGLFYYSMEAATAKIIESL